MLIFALLNAVLVGIIRYPTVCLICAGKRRRISARICIENQESKKATSRAIYNASPEMKRAAYHASPEEKRAASRVASRASCPSPRVPLFKAYLYSCCMLWSARISWFMTETDYTLHYMTKQDYNSSHHDKTTLPKKWQKQVT